MFDLTQQTHSWSRYKLHISNNCQLQLVLQLYYCVHVYKIVSLYEKRLCIRVDLNFFINYDRLMKMKRIFRRNVLTKLLLANATLRERTILPLFLMKERNA